MRLSPTLRPLALGSLAFVFALGVPRAALAQPTPPPSTSAPSGTTTTTPATTPANGEPTGTATAPASPPDGQPAAPDLSGTAGARAVGTLAPGAEGRGFMDTRLTWTFGDDDFLHKTGELVP